MRNTITKTVSMFLVVVMVLGISVMPFRASAGQTEINNLSAPALEQIAKLNDVWVSNDEEAEQALKALFLVYDIDMSVSYISESDMEGVAKELSSNGISAVFRSYYWDGESVWFLECDSIASFPVNIYGLYAPGGRVIGCLTGESDDSAATTSRPSYTAPSADVDIEYTQIFDASTNTWVDVQINQFDQSVTNNTTNNNEYWDVDNRQFWDVENNTYTTYNSLTYNPSTQTYNVQFSDNRSYTYQFYYDYTYITYIGSSAEYREAYKVYYELPDGRSSGDLTADELKGLSLQFDMINYDKAASDTLTKLLIPFDGDLDNDSFYPATVTSPTDSGYSFLESPDPFGGSLFVPITNGTFVNLFTATFETPLVKGDSYTVEGRFYLDGVLDSSYSDLTDIASFGLTYAGYFFPIFYFDRSSSVGQRIFVPWLSGPLDTYSAPVSSGVWYSFAYVYDGDNQTSCFYLNGQLCTDQDVGGLISAPRTYSVTLNQLVSLQNPVFSSSKGSQMVNIALTGIGFFNGNSSVPIRVDNLRVVSHPLYNGVSKIPVPQAPFDTNLVYVLPSVAGLNDNTVAIMSQLPVSGYRVGGIRPTDPTLDAGYVYMHIDGEFVDSVQQYNGSYWEEVTARLYTGVRWIPVTAFNVFTLEDMFDIIDPDADGSGDTVSDIYQYYLWWSGEWGTFQTWLQGTMQTLIEAIQASNGGGNSDAPVVIVPGYNDQTTTSEITTENPDGSTTKTTIVSNAAGLVYSNSVTTYPTDADGNTKTITVYTDSSGVMYQTVTVVDKDGNVTVTEPTQATGTLGAILKMITSGVMSIAGTVIEGFVTIVVDGVKFIIDSADKVLTGMGDLITQAAGSIQDLVDSVSPNIDTGPEEELDATVESVGFLDGILMIYPSQFRNAFNAMVLIGISLGLLALFIL